MNTDIILGIIQGITEWLPISSSGHLALAHAYFNTPTDIAYDLALHLGTLLAVFIYFRKELLELLTAIATWNTKQFPYLGKLLLATAITGILGFIFYDLLAPIFNNMPVIGLLFIINGLYLLFTSKTTGKNPITWIAALTIGLAQFFSILPSISRSGATIGTALLLGINKKEAFTFSFLLSIPAIIGANIFTLTKENLAWNMSHVIGIIIAAITGYIALAWCKRWLQENKFIYFGWYSIILGVIVLLITLF
ncbi:MAG: undecaprenyl-diphosphate phosphatase [Nanoarchaeota archaeon]|nr:undecaprenyl-diphosphate phosphatase [Nanoarchaeota archaeon]